MARTVAALETVACGWGRTPLLTDVSLTFVPSTLTVITGDSGAGKTLLLRTLWGEKRPLTGQFIGNQKNLSRASRRTRRRWRRRLGIFADDFPLYPTWSVYDNLALVLSAHGNVPRKIVTNRVLNELRVWDLLESRGHKANTLPSMQKRRLRLARAFVHRPKLALLDDPFAGFATEECEDLIRVVRHHVLAGTAVCLVTREWEHSLISTDRVFEIADGTLQHVHGTPVKLAESSQAG